MSAAHPAPTLLRLYAADDAPQRPSFPTRRSSDLFHAQVAAELDAGVGAGDVVETRTIQGANLHILDRFGLDRKRSEEHTSELRHGYISYAVFCLKKKNENHAYLK